jgi:hypothetical protein
MSATNPAGEWCGPTRQLKNSQLLALQNKSRSVIVSENLRVDVEVARDDEVVVLVSKPPESAAVIGSGVDALPEAVVLEPPRNLERVSMPALEKPREKLGSGSSYPVHRDTLRPLRVLLVFLVIAAGIAVTALVV